MTPDRLRQLADEFASGERMALSALGPDAARLLADAMDALGRKHFAKGVYLCRYCWMPDEHADDCEAAALLARLAAKKAA
jgi:hypothetical protein